MERLEKLPSIVYTAEEIEDLIRLYTQELGRIYDSTEKIRDLLMYSAMNRYHTLITSSKLQHQIKKEAQTLYNHLTSEFPLLKCGFTGRWKALISYVNKVISYLDKGRPLDDLKDMVAYRVTIDSDILVGEQLVLSCYKVLNKVIIFYLKRGYQLCYVDPVSDVLPDDSPLREQLIIPDVDLIPDEFQGGVKDYIRFPKASGYQSLHVILVHPDNDIPPIEVQIRTLLMDTFAQEGYVINSSGINSSGKAATTEPHRTEPGSGYLESYLEGGMVEGYIDSDVESISMSMIVSSDQAPVKHKLYKEKKYPNPVRYDQTQIRLRGFNISDDGEITEAKDNSGFEKPRILFCFPEK